MRLLSFVLPLVVLSWSEAVIIVSSQIDRSCGSTSVRNSFAGFIRFDHGPDIEILMLSGLTALIGPVSDLPSNQQAFIQSLLGTGTTLTANRASAFASLKAALGKLQAGVTPLTIQCGESSTVGVGLDNDGPDGPLMLFNFKDKMRVSKIGEIPGTRVLSICVGGGTSAYDSGHVVVLCPDFWNSPATGRSGRVITPNTTFNTVIKSNNLLVVGDSIDRLQDVKGFTLLHEFMHWSSFDGTNYGIEDANGYGWDKMVLGSTTSPALTADFYSYFCVGIMFMQAGYNFTAAGVVNQVPSNT